jgi:hypothetical protein
MGSSDQIACYQAIGTALSKAAPIGWTSIQANISLSGSQVDAVVSYQAAHGPGYLTGVPMLARNFYELARLISTEEKSFFKSCIFKLYPTGKYDVDFTY